MNQKLKILHLEDLPTDAELVARELKKGKISAEIKVVDNKEDFIRAVKTFSPDIILSDHSLPAFNSTEALKIVKEEGITIPFILITATVSEEFAVNVMKEGAHDYILKDRLQRLPNSVINAYEKYQSEKEREKYFNEVISSEALLKDAEHIARFGSWKADLITGETKWSDEVFRILGYKPGEMEPDYNNFLKCVHPDDVPFVKKATEDAVNDLDAQKLNFRVVAKDGSIKYIRSELVVKRDKKKVPVSIIGYNQDVTESTLTEESLHKSEANLKTIFNNTDTGYALLDKHFNILSFNQNIADWVLEDLRFHLQEGKNFIRQIPPNRREELQAILLEILSGNRAEYEIQSHHAKTLKWYHLRHYAIREKNEKIIGLCLTVRDITKQKQEELMREKITADLTQRNKDLEQFAYIVSHNLRGPVANMIGISNALNEASLKTEEKSMLMSGLRNAALSLDNTVKDLNLILQVKREINETKEKVKFSTIVEDIKISIGDTIKKNDIEIKYDFSEKAEIVSLKSYLHSIFFNLISNSIKYRQAKIPCVVEIKSHYEKNKIQLTFSDNGMGIDLKKRGDQVFGLYKRFHTNIEGKGMGLFMVKTQVETLGGKISVKSEPDNGTEFKIEFET